MSSSKHEMMTEKHLEELLTTGKIIDATIMFAGNRVQDFIEYCHKNGVLSANEQAHLVIADLTEARTNIQITIAATRIALILDLQERQTP